MNTVIYNNEDGMYSSFNSPCIFDNGKKAESTVYSDRLFQWDSKKYNKFCKKHFGNF